MQGKPVPAFDGCFASRLTSSQNTFVNTCMSQRAIDATVAAEQQRAMSASNPAATIARHKARYARAYVPPLALRQSQLSTPADTQARESQWLSQKKPRPNSSSQPPASAAPFAVSQQRAQEAPRPSGEWQLLVLSLQERQLECWRHLTDELQGLREEVRCIRTQLTERGGGGAAIQPAASSAPPLLKRQRSPHNDASPAASRNENLVRKGSACDDGKGGGPRHRMTVHSVRLIGGSATSTQAFAHDERASQEGGDGHAGAALPPASNEAADDGASADADSEADLFLL